jgi:DNA-binding winged helix-turn-helix (wHTH) protein/tetratricopeptide (TPR) repeat protein
MEQTRPAPKLVRFGVFEADLQESRLTKSGVRIKLQGQPFQILALLLQNPGQLVTREEIRQRLWSNDTFVEFDNGLNTAVGKLRTALGDVADNPRFVETVPRKGYRFVAPVTIQATVSTNEPQLAVSAEPSPGRLDRTSHDLGQASRSLRLRSYAWGIGVLILLVAALTAYWFVHRNVFRISSTDTVVLADFVNTTGEPVFDDALRKALEIGLSQSPSINVLSERKTAVIMKTMGRSPEDRMFGKTATEVCQRVGGKVTVQGSIASLGTNYLIDLAAIRCDNDEPVAHEQAEVKRKEDVVDALGKLTALLRQRMGESLPSIQKYNAPLEQATTGSLDALKAYSMALATWDRQGDAASIPFFKKAIELDPNFAMAYGGLSTVYHNGNETELARMNATKAYELRERVTEAEKISIESRYFLYVTGDLEKAAHVYELAVQNYPQSAGALNHLGTTYAELGRYENAADALRRALQLDPTRATTYSNLATDLLAQNNFDEAAGVIADMDRHKFQTDFVLQVKYWKAFVDGDDAAMQRILLNSSDIPGAQSLLLSEQANTEAYHGRMEKARELSRAAAQQMEHDGYPESAADCLALAAVREAEGGSAPRALDYISQAFKLAQGRDVAALMALVNARVGNITLAEKQSVALDKQYPSDTIMQRYWLPTVRASVDLRQGKPQRAVEELNAALPIEQAATTFAVASLYPAYVRGQAYLATGDSTKAIVEFKKFPDHKGLVLNCPLSALARLQLARACSAAHDSARAKATYEKFFQAWKDADFDLPILRKAKAEFRSLDR